VEEMKEKEDYKAYLSNTSKMDIYRIPLTQQKRCKLNRLLKKHVTRDLFKKGISGDWKYSLWKKHPVSMLAYTDRICDKHGYGRIGRSKDTSSPLIKILLRIQGGNKMEQLEEKKEVGTSLPTNFIQEIRERSLALAEEDEYKQELVKQAKEKGWLGVTIEEIDLDLTENYRKLSKQLRAVDELKKPELDILKVMQSLKRDKMDIYKFQMTMQMKIDEMEEKRKQNNRQNEFKLI